MGNLMKKETQGTLQAMIIDSDKYVRESLGLFFGKGPPRLLIFKSAAEGLNAMKYQDIDVVISDYFLPDMDGLTFLKHVAEEKPGIYTVLMATVASDELKTDIIKAGIHAFLEKPLSVASIDRILQDLNKERSNSTTPETKNER